MSVMPAPVDRLRKQHLHLLPQRLRMRPGFRFVIDMRVVAFDCVDVHAVLARWSQPCKPH